MTAATKDDTQPVTEYFWPSHLSGQELQTKNPQGTNVTISTVAIEDVWSQQTNTHIQKPVVYFEEFSRGLVVNKTNGRQLVKMFGPKDSSWIGKTVFIRAAKRSNQTIGIDIDAEMENG